MADAPQPALHDIAQRVKAKEKARDKGMDLIEKLKEHLRDDPIGRNLEGLKDWNKSLGKTLGHTVTQRVRCRFDANYRSDDLKVRFRSREILVGVIGETGLGKSSLINALLGCQIVPTSNSEACTAAVCIFGWNSDIANKKPYIADITFKSYEIVETELDQLKFELADLEETSRAQDENPDPEYDDRCAQAARQVRNVTSWSGLTKDQVRKASPEQIIQASPAFPGILKKADDDTESQEKFSKVIEAVSRQDFLDLLKPYVASSTGKRSGIQYWPLVEQVEVFLKSEVLRHGIKLVDLPGIMDATEGRAQIARDYFERLEKRIVATPATRAADNRAAADLILSEQETLILDMNDMLKPDSLCVAITKTDDIDCDSAEYEFPTDEILKICRELKHREAYEEDDSGEDEGYHNDGYQTGERRKRHNEALKRRVRQRAESIEPEDGSDFSRVDTGALKSRLKALCIRERNAELEQKVKENLLATRKKNRKSRMTTNTLTEVFPISSKAFQSLKRSNKEGGFEGFPDIKSTGIPDLKSWLDQVSLHYREEWVDGDIQYLQVLFDAVDGWNQGDDLLTLQLTGDEKTKVKNAINRLSAHLKEQINNKVRGTAHKNLATMKPLRNTTLKRKNLARKTAAKGEPELSLAVELLNQAVKGWESKNPRANVSTKSRHEKTHWSTYRACVIRDGDVFTRPSRNGRPKSTIDWMSDVSHAFWQCHFENWAYEFMRRIPTMNVRVQGTGSRVFTTWLKKIWEDEELPQSFRDLLKANAFKLEHLFNKYMLDVRDRIKRFQTESRKKRVPLKRKMAVHMRPGFEAAIQHKGNGFMAKQTQAVRAHTSAIGYNMFETLCNDLENQLADDIKKLSAAIANSWTDEKTGCGSLIKATMTSLCERLCGKKRRQKTSTRISNETEKRISDIISDWRSEWHRVFVRLPAPAHLLEEFEEVELAKEKVVNSI
ncbi:hypothetical protein LY78DRAFT_701032 [Colletotrichum sublineola]|nr:hypothetical protein LY78DRAFT_701032 [Colletotrichum sublineola]